MELISDGKGFLTGLDGAGEHFLIAKGSPDQPFQIMDEGCGMKSGAVKEECPVLPRQLRKG